MSGLWHCHFTLATRFIAFAHRSESVWYHDGTWGQWDSGSGSVPDTRASSWCSQEATALPHFRATSRETSREARHLTRRGTSVWMHRGDAAEGPLDFLWRHDNNLRARLLSCCSKKKRLLFNTLPHFNSWHKLWICNWKRVWNHSSDTIFFH